MWVEERIMGGKRGKWGTGTRGGNGGGEEKGKGEGPRGERGETLLLDDPSIRVSL